MRQNQLIIGIYSFEAFFMRVERIASTLLCIMICVHGFNDESVAEACDGVKDYDLVAKTTVIPKIIYDSSVLHVKFPRGLRHPSNFSINTPKGETIFLVFEGMDYQFIPKNEFLNRNEFEFLVSDIKGVMWKGGEEVVVKVFDIEGEYELWFADNLETEPENTYSIMRTVIYKGVK